MDFEIDKMQEVLRISIKEGENKEIINIIIHKI